MDDTWCPYVNAAGSTLTKIRRSRRQKTACSRLDHSRTHCTHLAMSAKDRVPLLPAIMLRVFLRGAPRDGASSGRALGRHQRGPCAYSGAGACCGYSRSLS
ncbi:uncharacterized protein LOC114359164 [Ostrinia furnacalis]|uniref:uncharacterized protein LOC114359164 n=1 Tax=Ostrinia furnacalis TaxID=93504 RepID=UPI001038EE42|nr:uncharacterized protein LOC114359164 [Ostrinia furnacalis]